MARDLFHYAFRATLEKEKIDFFLAASKAGKSMNAWMDEVLVHEAKNLITTVD